MKQLKLFSLAMACLMAFAGSAASAIEMDSAKVVPVPYGYSNPTQDYGQQPMYPTLPNYGQQPMYPTLPNCGQQQMYPVMPNCGQQQMYPVMPNCGQQQMPQVQPMPQQYNNCAQQNVRPTEYCTRWISGHWVQVRVMVPGRWEYRPVWIPGYQASQYKWVKGFWQTTASYARPDVYVWSSPTAGGYMGVSYQTYQNAGGGYFTADGVWVPNR